MTVHVHTINLTDSTIYKYISSSFGFAFQIIFCKRAIFTGMSIQFKEADTICLNFTLTLQSYSYVHIR